jgi:tetratricopeptide (TPR) repeat protein
MDDYREQHQQLLDRFSAALKKGGAGEWFDEDELLIIFDYAGDIGNDYLRTEALLWGARYFPESKALLERRCVYYADVLDDNAVTSFTSDIHDKGTLITDLLKYRAADIPIEEARMVLDGVMNEDGKNLEDEEVIQLVNFAFKTENSDWLYSNFDRLRAKTIFLPSLLFETAALSFENNDYEQTIPLLEELVGESPYSVEYWDMLAKSYFAAGREAEACDAIEMELAIDPEYLPALQIKAHKLAIDGKIAEIEKIAEMYPDDQEIAEARLNGMLVAYSDMPDKVQEIIDYMSLSAELFPQSDVFIDRLLSLAPEKAQHSLESIWDNMYACTGEDAARFWGEWADSLASEHKYSGALAVIEFFFDKPRNENVYTDRMRITQALLYFASQKWDKCYNTISNHRSETMQSNYMIHIAEVMSLIKLHCVDVARALALHTINNEKNFTLDERLDWSGVGQLTLVGLGIFMTDVIAVTEPSVIDSFNADKYDPLHFWN